MSCGTHMQSCRLNPFPMAHTDFSRVASEAFAAVSSGSTYVNRHDFKRAIVVATGWKPRRVDLERLLGQPLPADSMLSYDTFLRSVQMVLSSQDADSRLRALYQAFDTHGQGFIKREDALRIFRDAAPSVRKSTVEEAFDELDVCHAGRVSCDAFMLAFRGRLT